jgi:FKBP-type peptidyl-prolyl cis-trans isomerase SlyD
MNITKDTVVHFDYTLTGPDGRTIDSSEGKQPLAYLHGANNIIKGLENALDGKQAGDQLNVIVPAAEGYGERNEQLVQRVPRSAFQGANEIKPGMQFQARGPQGQTAVVTVTNVDPNEITVDANHPLAGVPLNFAVTVREVRAATQEELAHGHVHGAGGHHH